MQSISSETESVSNQLPRQVGEDISSIPVISQPLTPGDMKSGLFLLTENADTVEIAPGVLGSNPLGISKYPNGLAALGGDDYVRGSTDSEAMRGNQGNDTLEGQGGNDTLWGGQDSDVLYGGTGDDLLSGNLGNDYLFGDADNDLLRGGQGEDALVGGAGNDTLIGDLGVDRLWGSEGADVFVLRTDTATPPPVDCGCGNVDGLDEITSDFILDYNSAQGDRIGLTGGLTANDIVLTQKTITYGDRRDYDSSGPLPLGQIRTLDFQIESASVTVITEAKTGNVLGLVKGVSPAQLQFFSFSDSI
jgi:Ca2+-binding RTX toxin-like protein